MAALPEDLDASLAAADSGEDAIFALADDPGASAIDVGSLEAEQISGATMVAVRLKDGANAEEIIARLTGDESLGVKAAEWSAASGFYAQISYNFV